MSFIRKRLQLPIHEQSVVLRRSKIILLKHRMIQKKLDENEKAFANKIICKNAFH